MSSWEALDFILALEWPCREHVHHHAINPLSAHKGAETTTPSHNHALTATQTVYSCALEPSHSQVAGRASGWHLPYSEIEKYVKQPPGLPGDKTILEPSDKHQQTRNPLCATPIKRRHDDARASLLDNLSRGTFIVLRRGHEQKPYDESSKSAIVAKSILLWLRSRLAHCLLL